MKIRFFVILFFIFNMISPLFSAFEYKTTSVASASLAGIKTVCQDEANAVFYNPANINTPEDKKYEIAMYHTKLCGLDELNHNVLAIDFPLIKNTSYLAFGYNSFGQNDFYKEETLAVAWNFIFGRYKMGANLKSMYLSLGEMDEKTRTYGVDFGINAKVNEKSYFCLVMSNVNRPKIGRENREEIYRDFSLGYSIEPIKNIRFMLEENKIVGMDSENKIGVEMTFLKDFILRFGTAPKIDVVSVGFAINKMFEYAYNYHPELGSEHYFGVKFLV